MRGVANTNSLFCSLEKIMNDITKRLNNNLTEIVLKGWTPFRIVLSKKYFDEIKEDVFFEKEEYRQFIGFFLGIRVELVELENQFSILMK